MHWNEVIFYPGNEELQRFIDLGLLAARLNIPVHFHVEGVRGTGKTTLIRAARSRLPNIERVQGCLYNCAPDDPHCPHHKGKEGMAAERVQTPFLEISHSAKVGTVAGSIDLDKLTSSDSPSAALLPGTLPQAHRGIIFVDEINRLADTSPSLVDLLLDAMGTKPGRVQIEETGIPTVELPVNVSVWAASNPDEEPGPLQEIRRQLADRFDFVVRIERPDRPEIVRAIMNARIQSGRSRVSPLPVTAEAFSSVSLAERVEEFLSDAYIRFQLESIRGIQAARLGTLLHAARQGKRVAGFTDLAAVLPAALRHRLEPAKLQEITMTVKDAVLAGERKETVHSPRHATVSQEKAGASYPALWPSLWNRLCQRSSASEGKKETVLTPEATELQNEEKKTPALTLPETKENRTKL